MNLSSSTSEKKSARSGVFSGSWAIPILFVLVLGGWGGLRWYLYTLDNKLTGLETTIEANFSVLHGKDVDRVVHFDDRLAFIDKQLKGNDVNSQTLFTQLEKLVIPTVKLTEYTYNKAEKILVVFGETDNFKYVAQQMLSFKAETPFSNIRVDSLKYTKEGRIAFAFKAQL